MMLFVTLANFYVISMALIVAWEQSQTEKIITTYAMIKPKQLLNTVIKLQQLVDELNNRVNTTSSANNNSPSKEEPKREFQ